MQKPPEREVFLTVLAHSCHQLFHAVDAIGNHNQRFSQRDGVAQTFVTHRVVLNGIDVRDVRQPHTAANQLRSAETNGISPDLFQKFRGIARRTQRGIPGFLVRQRLEALRKGIP